MVVEQFHCDELVDALNSIPENYFGFETVADCLKTHPIDETSLQPYLHFRCARVARNLIFKNDLFELVALCWNAGQASPVQSFTGSKCWIVLSTGRLQLQTYQSSAASRDNIVLTDTFEIRSGVPVTISPVEPIHQLLNVLPFKGRAVSLHIYSPPISEQVVYGPQNSHRRIPFPPYDSRYGKRDHT